MQKIKEDRGHKEREKIRRDYAEFEYLPDFENSKKIGTSYIADSKSQHPVVKQNCTDHRSIFPTTVDIPPEARVSNEKM